MFISSFSSILSLPFLLFIFHFSSSSLILSDLERRILHLENQLSAARGYFEAIQGEAEAKIVEFQEATKIGGNHQFVLLQGEEAEARKKNIGARIQLRELFDHWNIDDGANNAAANGLKEFDGVKKALSEFDQFFREYLPRETTLKSGHKIYSLKPIGGDPPKWAEKMGKVEETLRRAQFLMRQILSQWPTVQKTDGHLRGVEEGRAGLEAAFEGEKAKMVAAMEEERAMAPLFREPIKCTIDTLGEFFLHSKFGYGSGVLVWTRKDVCQKEHLVPLKAKLEGVKDAGNGARAAAKLATMEAAMALVEAELGKKGKEEEEERGNMERGRAEGRVHLERERQQFADNLKLLKV